MTTVAEAYDVLGEQAYLPRMSYSSEIVSGAHEDTFQDYIKEQEENFRKTLRACQDKW